LFFGLVGESGRGKTTLGRATLKAAPISEGSVIFTDRQDRRFDLAAMDKKKKKTSAIARSSSFKTIMLRSACG